MTNSKNKTSPKVVAKIQFQLPSNTEHNVKRMKGMFNYFSKPEKQALNMFDYYDGKLKNRSFNLILDNGNVATYKDIKNLKRDYAKYIKKSILWKGIISFNNDYINKHIKIEDLEQRMVKEVMPRFLKECGFKNISNMSYAVALHTDTDNLHFHFCFIEKKPNYVTKQNKISYRKKGALTQNELNFLKDQVVLAVERGSYYKEQIIKINHDIDDLKKYFNPKEQNFLLKRRDILLEDKILKLGKMIEQYRINNQGRIKYNSIKDNEIKKLTKEIKDYLFDNKDSEIYSMRKNFELDIKDLNRYFNSIKEENNLKNYDTDNSYTKEKDLYLNNYVCNAIVNHANYINKYGNKRDEITSNDMIQSISFVIFKKQPKLNKKQRLKNILKHGYYISKQSIDACKRLDYESQKAQYEFSKLFERNYDNSYSNDYEYSR